MRVLGLVLLLASLFAAPSFAASPLSGRWRIVSVAGADFLDAGKTRAEFAASGSFASTVGCNRIFGKPKISGTQMTFGPMMATRMACPGALGQVERAYMQALRGVRGYTLEEEALTFLGEGGETLVTLERMR